MFLPCPAVEHFKMVLKDPFCQSKTCLLNSVSHLIFQHVWVKGRCRGGRCATNNPQCNSISLGYHVIRYHCVKLQFFWEVTFFCVDIQAIVLEWIAISFSRGSSQPRNQTRVSCTVDRRFTVWATREVVCINIWYLFFSLTYFTFYIRI